MADAHPRRMASRCGRLDYENETRSLAGSGSHSSTLFPSGSMTQANFPYSDSSIFSSTSQRSSFNDLRPGVEVYHSVIDHEGAELRSKVITLWDPIHQAVVPAIGLPSP